MKRIWLFALLLLSCSIVLADEIQIDTQFPGGNIQVDSIENGIVHVRPEQRGSAMNWFYYAFRVKNAQGQTLKFVFDGPNRVGARGPAISSDEQKTWRYLSDKPGFSDREFTYTFGPNENSMIFAQAILYTQKDWDAFIADYKNRSDVHLSTLCKTPKGRGAERLQFGNPDAKFGIALTCRHHCCEMTASLVLEGILQEALSDSETGMRLRQNAYFFVVPFVDKDGVEDGDQGKGRAPHDHNRDYNHERYSEISALKSQVPQAFEGKKVFFMDLHCPWIRSGMNEYVYFPYPKNEQMSDASRVFSPILERIQKDEKGEIPYAASNDLPFGEAWNNDQNYFKFEDGTLTSGSKMWASSLPGIVFAGSLEMPFSNASGVEVTRENSRELGRNIAKTIVEFLQKQEP